MHTTNQWLHQQMQGDTQTATTLQIQKKTYLTTHLLDRVKRRITHFINSQLIYPVLC